MKESILFFILIIIIFLGIFWYYNTNKNYNRVPKIMWTYWDNEDKIPKVVRMCMESWKKWNPDYEVILLTKKNYLDYANIPYEITSHKNFNDNPARFSDLVRINVLADYGGVWVDSSILLKDSIDKWLFPREGEFSGFYIDGFTEKKEYPVIENWFFACNKGSKFMRLWRDEFVNMSEYVTVEEYIKSRIKMGVDIQKINDPIYLAMHVAAQKVLQIDKYPLKGILLRKAEDGPFKYLVDTNWEAEKALELACVDRSYQKPIMKMRGGERNELEKNIDLSLSLERCGWLD